MLTSCLLALAVMGVPDEPKPAFTFAGQEYFHRHSKDSLHEFTPKGQADLEKWVDMVTLNVYAAVKDGDGLAKRANEVLAIYEEAGARVIRTASVPRTPTRPAEHLVVVLFPRPEFMEVAFARFVLDKGRGVSVVYSHRTYGRTAGDKMGDWLTAKGESTEKALMAMKPIPTAPTPGR